MKESTVVRGLTVETKPATEVLLADKEESEGGQLGD